jgi:tRNA (adenine57-N1/adenine58-N1)-methyltransferase
VRNVRDFLGEEALARYTVEQRDTYDGLDDMEVDRFVLDLPEPWRVVPHAARVLRGGGILAAYTPSIVQVMQVRDALSEHGFMFSETIEVLNRSWHVEGAAVRPDHRMVAHTGFLTTARRVTGG